MLRPALKALGALVLVVVAIVLVRTLLAGRSGAREAAAARPADPVEAAVLAEQLASLVRIPTVSRDGESNVDSSRFRLHARLAELFPRFHGVASREVVAGASLLYTWPGTDRTLPPIVLMAHQDVVPVTPGTEKEWTHPPFAGVVAGGYVWGRGVLDDKGALLTLLTALERRAAAGTAPRRTILVALGHDEEAGGSGARRTSALLAQRGITPWLVLDEGGVVTRGMLPGVARPTALVAVAEKGYVSVELVARGTGGHSSTPPRRTAIGALSRAVAALEREPMPGGFDGPGRTMLTSVAPAMSLPYRAIFANLWLTTPLVTRLLAGAPETDAMLRSTTAPTVLLAGEKENVLPQRARAVVNFRIHPRDRVEDVLAHVQRVVGDTLVAVRALADANEASPVAPTEGPEWEALRGAIGEAFPEALAAPYLALAATDARHFARRTRATYRFAPFPFAAGDLSRIHGTDERVPVQALPTAVAFYDALIGRAAFR